MACPIALPQGMTLKRAMYILQDGRCPYCGTEMVLTDTPLNKLCKKTRQRVATDEHLTPRSKGGDNSTENRMLVCFKCNCSRGDGPTYAGMYV